MDEREKLIEILSTKIHPREGIDPAAVVADFLLDHDVVPVKHGRWEFLGPNMLNRGCMCGTCSACKVRSEYIVNTGLCPNCGAQMDGGADNDAD